jgi:hypothetical protein
MCGEAFLGLDFFGTFCIPACQQFLLDGWQEGKKYVTKSANTAV